TDIPLFVKTAEQARDADYSERFTCENRMVKQDGSVRWVSTLFQKVKYADDTDSIQIIFSDITDRILPDLDKIIEMLSSMYSVVLMLDFARDAFQIFKTEGKEDSDVVCRNDSIATGTRWIEEHVCEEERAELLKMYTEEYRNQAFEKKEFPTTEFHIVKDGALIPCASTMMKVDNERCFWCMTELSEKKTA
ncbi:MAG: PAS domain-containing protein, partial [Solobacterium sp.]|nr:PAS domain-containing protein [Solobacterium sp.]